MSEKCGCTGLECAKCNPGPCDHREISIKHDEDKYVDHMKRMYNFTRNPDEKWASAVEKMLRSKSEKQITRPSKDEYYLNIALAVSKRSTCLKRHYGCVIVKDDIIAATGYNGSPRGEENCCDRGSCKRADAERYTGYENCDSVHAEQNAIIAASHQQLRDATLYLACESYGLDVEESGRRSEDVRGYIEDMNPVPCPICRRMIRNSGISRVVNRLGDVLCL